MSDKARKDFEERFKLPDDCYFDASAYAGGKAWWLQQDRWETWQACLDFYKINPNKPSLEELIEATPKECWAEWWDKN